MTQQELAERANLSVEAISQLERGARTRPQRETVAMLARALDLSPDREAVLTSARTNAHLPRRRARLETLDPPKLRLLHPDSEAVPRHNLPHDLTSFVARKQELSEIAQLLRENQVLTVLGAGGVGKTRAALQLGGHVLSDYPDGVWLVDFAPLAREDLVEGAISAALQLPATTTPPLEVVLGYLKKRRLLLILDNCEHVTARVREVTESIARACPSVCILATSRQAMGVNGEREYRLPSLAFPLNTIRAEEMTQYGAVKLFVDRAASVDAIFTLSDDNAPDVADICRRLDGIPLAIELAAARINVLAPRQIAQRLNQRFRLLAASHPGGLLRHQTMTASLDWSYHLLTPREQSFFESLSIFAGGCTIEAATDVCVAEGEDDIDVIELISSLAAKSLLVTELAGDERRYRFLESTRQYARDKLVARGEDDTFARRHALAYLRLAEGLDEIWSTTAEGEWLARAQAESQNWRAALDWALVRRRDVTLGQRLAALRTAPALSFARIEAQRWVRLALEAVEDGTPLEVVAQLELADADATRRLGEFRYSLDAASRALALYRQLGNVLGAVHSQSLAGVALAVMGKEAAADVMLREALASARATGDRHLMASVMMRGAIARSGLEDYDGARNLLAEARALARTLGADSLAIAVGMAMAGNEFTAGDAEAALEIMADVLASARDRKLTSAVAYALSDMAQYFVTLGRYDEARSYSKEALEVARGLGLMQPIARSLQHLVAVATLRSSDEGGKGNIDFDDAARISGFVRGQLELLGSADPFGPAHDRSFSMLRDRLGHDSLAELMAAGAAMTEDEAIALTLQLE